MFRTKVFGVLAAVLLAVAILMPAATVADEAEGLAITLTPSVTAALLGDNISYSYLITSSGNTTISSLSLTDTKFGEISLPATSIGPGENISTSFDYTVVTGDFPGPISNTATVTGVSADNLTYTASAASSVTLEQTSSVQVSISASVSSASVGDNITYTYVVTNSGQAAVDNITLTDSRLGAVSLSVTALDAASSLTVSRVYTVLDSDRPGPLVNSATVKATSATGEQVTATSADVSVSLSTWVEDILTKAGILKNRGVPGKGIEHAPGLQKPFNPNSHMGSTNSPAAGNDDNDQGNGNGNGNGNGRGKGKNK